MRNPKWHRDEVILALELYFRTDSGQINSKNPDIIELSDILNKLPIHDIRPDSKKFRNPNGIALKLSNFLAIDPNYQGKGMASYSKLDFDTFMEFADDKERLKKLVRQIKETIANNNLTFKLYNIENEENHSVKEGLIIYKLHKYRERNSSINKSKKEKIFKEKGKLECEVCGFDFYKFYGKIGERYIECHHKKPLSEVETERITTIDDLALVCSNCHSMLHREINTISINELKTKIKK